MDIKAVAKLAAYGLVLENVKPDPREHARLLALIEPSLDKCNMCGEQAVRVGVYPSDDNMTIEIRALCERHKGFGIWDGYNTAWGWD